MNRSQFVAVAAGTISLILALAYLILVQLLDLRGEMIPAPDTALVVPILLSLLAR
jgi:hypothetical protein